MGFTAILAREKLELEVAKLRREVSLQPWQFVASSLQAAVIVIGIVIGANEFFLKTRAEDQQRRAATLLILERVNQPPVRTSLQALQHLRDSVYSVPADSELELSRFPSIATAIEIEATEMAYFFKTIEQGVQASLFDEELVVAFLETDLRRVGGLMNDIMGRMGPMSKIPRPDYEPFCGMFALLDRLPDSGYPSELAHAVTRGPLSAKR